MKRCVLAALSVLLLVAPSASAQYFGRNKVQHKAFNFQVLRTEHFDVYFYSEERDAAGQAARMAERWYARLSQIFDEPLSSMQPLVLYASHADFEQSNIIQDELGEGTGGVTEPLKRRIVLPLAPTMAETDHVIGHELVHAFQYDIADRIGRGGSDRGRGIEQLPLWFIEGMAEYLSVGPIDPHTAMWIRDAAREQKVPTIRQLNSSKYFPYRWGQAFWAYVAGRWGDGVLANVLDVAIRDTDAEAALKRVLGVEPKVLSSEWQAAIHAAYDPFAAHTHAPSDYARRLTSDEGPGSELNVSPSLSPDGTRIVYFSERNLISVDMMLAEVATGRVTRSIITTALDPHFSSLQFIGSAGSWSPDGRRFAFGAVADGRAELVIYDVDRAVVLREIPFPAFGELLSPSWSPDARFIAFSATEGGVSDIFVYDLESGSLRRLTADAFADLQPVWSPDGRSIAFVTERFGGDAAVLRPGDYRLAILDVPSARIHEVETFADGKSISPAWAPDSGSLYFLSDHNGVMNAYAIRLADRAISSLTNLYTGISGITAVSPALSSATAISRVAFSAYDGAKYRIYVADAPAQDASTVTVAPQPSPAMLPPSEREPGELLRLLADSTIGLPETAGDVETYHARLSLDAVGQPYVTAGIDPYGSFVGGGVAFLFSDMLGNHNLIAAVQTDTSFGRMSDIARNTAGMLAYTNLTHRWNWSAAAQQVPYLSGAMSSGVGVANGGLVQTDELTIIRQTSRAITGIAAYPFSRARRVEVSSAYQQISFDSEVNTIVTSLSTGQVLSNRTATNPLAHTLNLATVGAATVFDNSVFGATSPVAGRRYRLEMTPTVGTIVFSGVLADYRHYVAPVPFYTIAVRGLHYGRYGGGAEDYRLPPLFLGYPQLIRGYDIGSFDTTDCRPASSSSCPAFDRLLGSRMLVGNLELRFPLLRPFGMRANMYGPLPVEVALFGDGGVAWTSTEKPSWLGGDRKPVASTGVTLRINLFGFAVGQMDFARPLQRPGRGWMFEFSLTPGF